MALKAPGAIIRMLIFKALQPFFTHKILLFLLFLQKYITLSHCCDQLYYFSCVSIVILMIRLDEWRENKIWGLSWNIIFIKRTTSCLMYEKRISRVVWYQDKRESILLFLFLIISGGNDMLFCGINLML